MKIQTLLFAACMMVAAGGVCAPPPATTSTGAVSGIDDSATAVATVATGGEGGSRRSGAHGRRDPHAGLDSERRVEVALRHRAEGRLAEAMIELDKAVASAEAAPALAVRGSLHLEQGRVAAALEDLNRSLRLEPDNAETLTNRALALRRFRRDQEALADLDRALSLAPDLIAARFNRGALRFERGDFTAAAADFDHCLAVDPHAAGCLFNRAMTRDAAGDRATAIDDMSRFLDLTTNESWRLVANQQLEQWRVAEPATVQSDTGSGG